MTLPLKRFLERGGDLLDKADGLCLFIGYIFKKDQIGSFE
jgi:hypothetical protein